ncbi:acyl-CoA dehydrogenase family protein [Abyssibacter profundi]|uniref:Acyl-CoA dehydrogenase n=1 Tax=Abyssibacter profundi TaxID=2182787 RepID=A0A363UJT4_9GAMM|nr:acyl-CoA dehydrogenase family protein [Abyssibacter profundi]PWN55637.1 acyl-CoA dehydrogenase [Abyssibacter profundi]
MPMYWETEEHGRFRDQVRRFTEQAVMPHLDGWEAEGRLPVSLHQQAAEAGILQIGFPEAYGGIEVPDGFYELIVIEELCRAGSGGLIASLLSLGIGLPPIVALGSEALKARVLPPVLRGDAVSALAITEPGGGSDVANLQTRARLQDDHYVLDGSKTFITSGMRADWLTVAARTGPAGMQGITLFAVPGDAPGLDRSALDKMGWRCSDTATLYFQNCRVPADCVIGQVNAGFLGIMRNFNNERLALAAQAVGLAQCAYDEALGWARERETFGKPLIQRQVIRHRLVDMLTAIRAQRACLYELAWRCGQGEAPIAELCMLKNGATSMLEQVAGEAVQILGGSGYLTGCRSERIFRETKVLSIGGGASEVMKDLAARQLGL